MVKIHIDRVETKVIRIQVGLHEIASVLCFETEGLW